MLEINVPGLGQMNLNYLVMDFNGTMARDGVLRQKITAYLNKLSKELKIYVVSADTYGTVAEQCAGLPVEVVVTKGENGALEKGGFVDRLGGSQVVAIGNGNNDSQMLEKSCLGICIAGEEGCSVKAMLSADIVVTSITDALGLLIKPEKIQATLRL